MGLSLLLVDLVQPVEDGGCRASSWFACKIMTDRAAVGPLRALELRMERTLTKFVPVRVSVDGLPGPGPHVTDQWLTTAGEMIHDYWWDISGGREDVQWRLYPDVVLPSNQPAVGPAELILAVRDIAVKMGAPFQDDEHLIVIMDHPASNLGVTETDPLIAAKDVDVALICHEMGHFYQRLNHQPTGHADSFSPFRPLEYDDPTCIMGAEHSLDGGGKYSFQDPGMAIAGSPGHDDVGPGMCPPMTAATGWLDEHDPLAVTDVTHSLPIDVQIDVWTGAPAAGRPGRSTVIVCDGMAPGGDRVYISLRSPATRWDAAMPPLDGLPQGAATIVAQEKLSNGGTALLAECPAVTGASMRLGRATLRVEVRDGGTSSSVLQVGFEPWRKWGALKGPAASRVAAAARADLIDLAILGADGLPYTISCRNGIWDQFVVRPGASFRPTAGIALVASSVASMDFFAVGIDNLVRRNHFGLTGWEAVWAVVDGGNLDQDSSLAACAMDPDKVELFASDRDGRVLQCTLRNGSAGSWSVLPPLPAAAHALSAETLSDRSIQVHAITDGVNDERMWSIAATDGSWESSWTNHGQVMLNSGSGIASASHRDGSAILVGAADPMLVRRYQTGHWVAGSSSVDGLPVSGFAGTIAAVSRNPTSMLIFAIGTDDVVHPILYSDDVNAAPGDRQALATYDVLISHVESGMLVKRQDFGGPLPHGMLWPIVEKPGASERFTFRQIDTLVDADGEKALLIVQASGGEFLSVSGGILLANGTEVNSAELFMMWNAAGGSGSVFKTFGGYYWSGDPSGRAWFTCDATIPGSSQRFAYLRY